MNIIELKKELKESKTSYGIRESVRAIKKGKAEKIFISKNLPKEKEEEIENYCKVSKIPIVKIDASPEQIAEACKEEFNINIICKQKK
ncbi:hypothetical protein CO154_00445 [Candidatus Pacearchaeota archaeon CG_4_9_14_3_um_filter_31_7]|nr:MAG: hypothetical protein AUJ10_00200 [Candidatus Pacearchaeota archaeon CG1_02_31_27]PIN92236.1 MAG: hypothetical protein COU55_01915 [Candidatus Pacearchaeota archaeon CG10_big_fil_rev_8_21_14_0_10_31_59]PJA70903.1 MAG: hypothetical protein CO154_00445 [Candidatus Pacearchaeota archaeon CG_4_9_14_3_um_filter_31_7]